MKRRSIVSLGLLASVLIVCSCGEDGGRNTGPNMAPSTVITAGPAEGSTHSYRVDMAWRGTDSDGRVTSYEIAWHSGAFDSAMLASLDWESTAAAESTFTVLADSCCVAGDSTMWKHTHTFFVRAVDDDGESDPEPPHRSFTATTTAPTTMITSPTTPIQSSCVTFRWNATDEDGEAAEYRYVWKRDDSLPEDQPPDPENPAWSDWAPHNEWTERFMETDPTKSWSFYVQCKDNAGAIETTFRRAENRVVFYIDSSLDSHPWIKISCFRGKSFDPNKEFIAARSTSDSLAMENPIGVSAGDTLSFRIEFHAGDHASRATRILIQEDDPYPGIHWDAISPGETEAIYPGLGEIFTASMGIRTLYVWVEDDYCHFGSKTRAYMKIQGS